MLQNRPLSILQHQLLSILRTEMKAVHYLQVDWTPPQGTVQHLKPCVQNLVTSVA